MGKIFMVNSCQVCGDPNAVNHFGAISCKACGAFFRRLVVRSKKYICKCAENEITKVDEEREHISRCRGYRLKKCLKAGMKENAVRSAVSFRFHKERKKHFAESKLERNDLLLKSDDAVDANLLQKLLEIEAHASRMLYASGNLSDPNFFRKFRTLEQLVLSKENLFSAINIFNTPTPSNFDREKLEKMLAKFGIWRTPAADSYKKCSLLSIYMAKMLPGFAQLGLDDQIASIHGFVAASFHFSSRFFSMRKYSRTSLMNTMDYPIARMFTVAYGNDPIVQNLAATIYTHPMGAFLQIMPSREEFILLMALLFCNPATSSLSDDGKAIMNAESEKCGRILLRFQQQKFGQQAGALRYVQTLQLIWTALTQAQKHREMIVYIDTMYERGRFEEAMPPILTPLLLERHC